MQPKFNNGLVNLYQSDARHLPIQDSSVHCVVTSPPYYNLRKYRADEGLVIGNESSPEEYVKSMLDVFREVKRVLRDDGICWVNLGDSYAGGAKGGIQTQEDDDSTNWYRRNRVQRTQHDEIHIAQGNMIGIPWRFALAMQEDGWVLRNAVIWAKSAPMPESVNGTRWERCKVKSSASIRAVGIYNANAYEYSQGAKNGGTIDGSATWEDCTGCEKCNENDGLVLRKGSWRSTSSYEFIFQFTLGMGYFSDGDAVQLPSGANRRDVWRDIHHESYGGDHFATFPPDLPRICIQASTSEAGVCSECGNQWARVVSQSYWKPTCTCNAEKVPALVLDPFSGTATTLLSAMRLGRRGIGVDISDDYINQAINRLSDQTLPMMLVT